MASEKAFVDRVAGLLTNLGTITARQMFGEWALYVETKLVLLICDNKVFVKPTVGGGAYWGAPVLAPAYPGAKDSYLVEAPWEDSDRFLELIRITARELPEPKPKKPKPQAASEAKQNRTKLAASKAKPL